MIETLRAFAKSWVAMLLLSLLVISFAAWGITDMFSASVPSVAAKVGDEKIRTEDFNDAFRGQLERLGNISPSVARQLGLDQLVLRQMATTSALNQETERLGISAGDDLVRETITSSQTFTGPNGEFDPEIYNRLLAVNGLQRKEYEARIRQSLSQQQLMQSVAGVSTAPQSLAQMIWAAQNEQRSIAYVELTAAGLPAPEAPGDETLATFHSDNADMFTAPEYRSIRLLWLNAAALADPQTVTDDAARAAYEAQIDSYRTPEKRNLDRLIFDDMDQATEALARIRDGESFDKLVRERGFTASDVAMGYVTSASLDPALAEATFGETTSGVVGPVETAFGPALINIQGVMPASETPFEEVAQAIKQRLATQSAGRDLPEQANSVEDLRAAGATLAEVGDQEGLPVPTLTLSNAGLDPEGNPVDGLPPIPDFFAKVFAMEIGEEMDLTVLPDGSYYAVEVADITPAALQPLEQVRSDVLSAWTLNARREAAAAKAKDIEAQLAAGASLQDLAAAQELEVQELDTITRTIPQPQIGEQAQAKVFAAEEGAAFSSETREPGRYIIGVVRKILPADPETAREVIAQQADQMGAGLSEDLGYLFANATIDALGFESNPNAIDYVLGYSGR
ncbi:MAG: SurA N-terminal domain-containing protein [Neomegalonema sp.]|nr:SurA N-terminal domain-containing protein [Neomegalonema sp.]